MWIRLTIIALLTASICATLSEIDSLKSYSVNSFKNKLIQKFENNHHQTFIKHYSTLESKYPLDKNYNFVPIKPDTIDL